MASPTISTCDGFLDRLLPAEGAVLSAATVAAGTALAVAECLRAGITTALDMYFFPEAAAAVAAAAGFDLRGGPVFVEFPGADGRRFDDRMAWAAELLEATSPGRRWVCPHSTYLLDEPQLRAVGDLAATSGARVHVHACETVAELDAVRGSPRPHADRGARVTPGCSDPRTVLAHGVHLDDHDLDLVAASGAAVAHCPASNQKLGSGFARIPELLAAGVPVALGTDGAASANDLDPWLAMRLAAYPLTARCGVGTITARRRAGDGDRRPAPGPSGTTTIGSIEVGKRADLVVLDPTSPALTPSLRRGVDGGLRRVACRCALGRRRRARRRRRPRAHDDRRRGGDRRRRRAPADHRGGVAVNVDEAREAVHAACLRMVDDGLVIGSAGNISVRVDEHHFVVTAAGVPYDELTPADHPVVDARDRSVGADRDDRRARSPCTSASCAAMPDVGAVVHTHSRYAAAFAVARLDLPFICNESIATRAERVMVTEYAPPGSGDLGAQALAHAARPTGQPRRPARQPRRRRRRPGRSTTPTSSPSPSSGPPRSATSPARWSRPAPASTSSTARSGRHRPQLRRRHRRLMDAAAVIARFGLQPLPVEGGWFRRYWRSPAGRRRPRTGRRSWPC